VRRFIAAFTIDDQLQNVTIAATQCEREKTFVTLSEAKDLDSKRN
jgi:hypothetical protein